MISKDLFKKVRQIEITTSKMVTDIFAGAYHSVFKGQGIEFDEVREYNVGDDIRSIDWNVTARTGKAHIKKFVEERELTVMILVDASGSNRFASTNILKNQLAAEIAAVLALAATKNNDKTGLIIFTDRIEKYIPPRKGLRHVLRIIREVLYFEPKGLATRFKDALEFLNKVTVRRSIAFMISDFIGDELKLSSIDELKKVLSMTNRKHDLIAVTLNDPREMALTDCGILSLEDAETGELIMIDSSNAQLRQKYSQYNQKRVSQRTALFNTVGVDHIDLTTGEPYSQELIKFFIKRKRRK